MKYKKDTIPYVIGKHEMDVTNIFVFVDMTDLKPAFIKRYALSGESAQEASFKLYDTSEYYWILYLLNDVVNPHEDWYMSPSQLRIYAEHKYTNADAPNNFYYVSTGEYLSHKASKDMMYLYEQGMGLPHDVNFNTNYQYEMARNEEKKVIKTVTIDNLLEFINVYNERLNIL